MKRLTTTFYDNNVSSRLTTIEKDFELACRRFTVVRFLLFLEHFLDGKIAVDLDCVIAAICLCISDHCRGQIAGFDRKPSTGNPVEGRSNKPERILKGTRFFSIAKQEAGLED